MPEVGASVKNTVLAATVIAQGPVWPVARLVGAPPVVGTTETVPSAAPVAKFV